MAPSKRDEDQARRAAAKATPVLPKPPLRGQPSPEDMARQMSQQQAQQQMYNEQRSLRIREVMALEAIAEALHVANEEKILAWREVQAKKQAEEEARVAREQAEARAADFEAVKKTVPEANRLGEVVVHGSMVTDG